MWEKRDLIILSKNAGSGAASFEREVRSIHDVLYHVEGLDNFCVANEIIDINHYRVVRAPYLIQKILADKMKPFVFVFNKN